MLALLAFLITATPQTVPSGTASGKACEYDPSILELGFENFDQDMKGGWRALADQAGCEGKAADVVRDYRQKYQSIMQLLYWHEAQLRAFIGENVDAVRLMEQSRKPDRDDQFGWNPYVDATIAFLRKTKLRLSKHETASIILRNPTVPLTPNCLQMRESSQACGTASASLTSWLTALNAKTMARQAARVRFSECVSDKCRSANHQSWPLRHACHAMFAAMCPRRVLLD